jgi:hypothetical protein
MRLRQILPALFVAIALAGALAARAGEEPVVFTSPPTDIGNVAGIIPLGNTNPGGDHVVPVDHMYLEFPSPDNGGADAYPVYAMAAGEIVLIQRMQDEGKAHPDYQIFIRHSKKVTSYFDHVNELSASLQAYIDAAPIDPWLMPAGPDIALLFFGQLDGPAPFPVGAGEQIGTVRSYSFSWDVGVVDAKVKHRVANKRRYPDLRSQLRVFGVKVKRPHKGHEVMNGACFIDYLSPGLQASWTSLFVSTSKQCGSHIWDVKKTLQGSWFNPALGKTDVFETDAAAIAIGPDNYAPDDRIQIAIGSGGPFSVLDPTDSLPQLDRPFLIEPDPAPSARVNPDPAQVTRDTGTVCYDLEYDAGMGPRYNLLRLHLESSKALAIDFDPTPLLTPGCTGASFAEPDESWTTRYVR